MRLLGHQRHLARLRCLHFSTHAWAQGVGRPPRRRYRAWRPGRRAGPLQRGQLRAQRAPHCSVCPKDSEAGARPRRAPGFAPMPRPFPYVESARTPQPHAARGSAARPQGRAAPGSRGRAATPSPGHLLGVPSPQLPTARVGAGKEPLLRGTEGAEATGVRISRPSGGVIVPVPSPGVWGHHLVPSDGAPSSAQKCEVSVCSIDENFV